MVSVRVATAEDREAVGLVLARAFASDPVLRWMLPTNERDVRLFRAMARYAHPTPGWADLALDGHEPVGAALWDPPGFQHSLRQKLVGYPAMLRAMGLGLRRGMLMESVFTRHRPDGRFWYLGQLGASPQGKGVGSALLEHRLASCDGPSYLESSHPANIPLYERFGYEVVDEFTLPEDGPPVWAMLRPAPNA